MLLFAKLMGCALLGYLTGCLNPAFLIGLFKGYDVRRSGSGNAGASNTVLMAGKLAGFFVAIADILKAALAWYAALLLLPDVRLAPIIAGVSCILGHMFPIFLRFRGGKGLACLGGVILAYDLESFLFMLSVALLIALLSNYVAVVTVSISAIFPLYYALLTGFWLGACILAVPAVPILIKHMENFRRIASGQELRLSYLWNRDKELDRTGYSEK